MSEPIGVLHVDDEPDFAEVTADFLEREDDRIEVVTETRVSDGLDRLATEEFDCIISDYDMPEIDGLAFLEHVRHTYDDLPFILFTGKGSEEVASEALSAGATDYLQKEVGTDQYTILANRVVNSVETARAKSQRQRQLDAIETAQDGISLLDDDGQFIYVNEAYADLYGYAPEDMIGEHWALIYPDDDVEFVREEILPAVTEEGEWRGETTGLRADGSTFVEDHTLSTTDNGALICTVRDVTVQKKREQEFEARSAAMEAASDAIALLDASAEYTYVNQAHAEVYGHDDPEAFIGESWQMCYTEDELVTIEETVMPALEAEGEWRGELTGRRCDGSTFPQEVTLSVRDDGGMVCIVRDVSERERAENRFRVLFENMPDPAVIVEFMEDDAITRAVNAAFEDVFGYSAETAVDTSLNDLIVPPEFADESEQIDQAARSGDQLTAEVRRQTVDGDRQDFLFRNVLIENAEGEPRSHGIYTDITARKQRERRLNSLHEATRDLMLADTRQEVAEIASRATRDVLELPLNGVHLYDEDANGLVPLAASPETREVVGDPPVFREGEGIAWQVFKSGESQRYRDVRTASTVHNPETLIRSGLYLPLGDHGVLLIGSTSVADFDESDVSLAKLLAANVAIALDRVDHERELQRQNDRLENFANVVSHDLRNPLTIAQGHLELAEETGDAVYFEEAARAQNRMKSIIDDILTLARQGDAIGETQSIALDTVARRAWNNVETESATLQHDTDHMIEADVSRVSQLFENLFRNAIEHAGEKVTVHIGGFEDCTGFYIEDTGPGIPREERARIFESGYTTESEGTGFGLAIVKEIADAHGWEIDVTDGEEGGARFEITIESGMDSGTKGAT